MAKSGMGAAARKRWEPVFKSLIDFLKHDDASRISRSDLIRWKVSVVRTFGADGSVN
jgi:hypothetical protein